MTGPFARDELVAALIAREPALADPARIRLSRAPGRVNLLGEHTDYNLGFVLPVAIDREVRLAVVPTDDRRVELIRLPADDRRGFDLDTPGPRDGSWLDYIVGTARALVDAGHPITGLRGVIVSDLPENAGLSSSAAIELATAWALLGDAAEAIDPVEIARVCQRAENAYVGVQSGLMDQFAAACGIADRALFLDCRSLSWRSVALPADLLLVVLHSGVRRSLGDSAFNERRSQCEAAVAALAAVDPTVRSLRDVGVELLAAERRRMDPIVARRAEHVISENARVIQLVEALERGDLGMAGELFAASHRSLRDLYEVSSPELDALVEIASQVDGVVASRMTGAGFGGCTVNLVRPEAVLALGKAVRAQYQRRTGLTATVMPVRAADGASWVR